MMRTLLFDLDDTLYPRQAGIMNEIRAQILRYIETRLGLSPAEADILRDEYLEMYGTTMRGLQVNHHIDPDEYLEFVHDIPLNDYLQPNPALDEILASIPYDKIIFTNASRQHAERVLGLLGIRRHFSRILDIRDMDFRSKPHPCAYERVCEILNLQPRECILAEDNLRNLRPAKALGMTTILVGADVGSEDCVDHALERIEEIGAIWGGKAGSG